MDWLKWYHGACSDSKWPLIARKSKQTVGTVVAIWAALLEHASQNADRGSLAGFDPEEIDCLFGYEDGVCHTVMAAMSDKGMIVDGRIAAWEKRQTDEAAAERKRLQREREKLEQERLALEQTKRDMSQDVTDCHGDVTPMSQDVTECHEMSQPVTKCHLDKRREDKNLKGIKNLNTQDYEGNNSARANPDPSAGEVASPLPELDEPGLEFLELRQFYDENVRTEGPRAGFDEYKRLRASRDRTGLSRWPGINRIKDDLTARMEAGVWGKGFAIGLARYLTEQTWMAKIVPRAAPEDQSWEARESARNNAAFLAKYGGINPDGTPIAKLNDIANSVAQACAM